MKDLIIIGAGPAATAAAIYAKRRQMDFLLIGKSNGGQLVWAGEIENYPGFNNIDAFDLITKFSEQLKLLNVEQLSAEVKKIEKTENSFMVYTDKEQFESKTVIVAIGLTPKRLAIPGELEFTGKGISYCATCDGPLFKNKKVAVVGGGNSALDAAEYLSKVASEVYLINNLPKFTGFENLSEEIQHRSNVKIFHNSKILSILGDKKVHSVDVETPEGVESFDLDGVFIEVGRVAATDLVAELTKRDEKSQIIVDINCATSCSGLFAAGDVTNGQFKQITTAVGQGTTAALASYKFVQELSGNKIANICDRSIKK